MNPLDVKPAPGKVVIYSDARARGPRLDQGDGADRIASLALRLDEAALAVRQVTTARIVICLLCGVMGALMLPWQVCLAWSGALPLLEVWASAATRVQSRGEAGWPARTNFAGYYLALNLWLALLGVLLWRTGALDAQASALIMLLTLGALLVLLFHNVPWGFLAAGAAPAIAAMSLIALADGHGWRQLLPIWMATGLCMSFVLGRALDTPSAQAAQRRLNDSLTQYRTLAENVTDIISRTDLLGVYQYVSSASIAVLGYHPEDLVGTLRRDIVDPGALPEMRAALDRMLADPAESEVLTYQARHKDGRWLWLQSSARLICERGVPVGLIDVSRDVTAQVAADIALREARAEAESATRAKAQFLANVSHEVQTPMNGVLGALHLLAREPLSPEGRGLLLQANDCGRVLSQLLNDVLDFSKIEAGRLDLAPEPMNLGEALETVTALLGTQARAKGVEMRCDVPAESIWIEADPVRLRQAMFNLLGNAVKFTANGHVAARLIAGPIAEGRRHIRLQIEDTGIGMTADAQSQLFERFRQGENDTARRFAGMGLGLSITQALAHMMGGEVGFTSVEGEGSTFWLDFDAPDVRAAAAETVDDGMLSGVSILLVEDNPTNRLVASTMLSRLGANIDEAEDGFFGLEAARLGVSDLILMDIQMPRMDGVEATHAIRRLQGPAGRVPIIAVTANAMAGQKEQYLAAGMNGVVAKPISPGVLLGEIVRALSDQERAVAV